MQSTIVYWTIFWKCVDDSIVTANQMYSFEINLLFALSTHLNISIIISIFQFYSKYRNFSSLTDNVCSHLALVYSMQIYEIVKLFYIHKITLETKSWVIKIVQHFYLYRLLRKMHEHYFSLFFTFPLYQLPFFNI